MELVLNVHVSQIRVAFFFYSKVCVFASPDAQQNGGVAEGVGWFRREQHTQSTANASASNQKLADATMCSQTPKRGFSGDGIDRNSCSSSTACSCRSALETWAFSPVCHQGGGFVCSILLEQTQGLNLFTGVRSRPSDLAEGGFGRFSSSNSPRQTELASSHKASSA